MDNTSGCKPPRHAFWLVLIMLAGCATTPRDYGPWGGGGSTVSYEQRITVQIESLSAADGDDHLKTYAIASAMQGVDADDLQFREFARQLENGLSRRGYVRTDNENDAQLLVRLAYGVGDAKTSTVTTSYGYSYPIGWWWYHVPPRTEQVTIHTRNIFIEAVDLTNPQRKTQRWKTTLQSKGGIPNIRQLFPFMIAAGVPYFGTNQPATRTVEGPGQDGVPHNPRMMNSRRFTAASPSLARNGSGNPSIGEFQQAAGRPR